MNEVAPQESMIERPRDPGKPSPEMLSRARISKAVGDIDRLCGMSKLTVDEALTAFAVITAIKLSELTRDTQLKWQRFFDGECKHQRKIKLQIDAQKPQQVVIDEAAGMSQEAIDALKVQDKYETIGQDGAVFKEPQTDADIAAGEGQGATEEMGS